MRARARIVDVRTLLRARAEAGGGTGAMLWLLIGLIAIALFSGMMIVVFLIQQLDADAAAIVAHARCRG